MLNKPFMHFYFMCSGASENVAVIKKLQNIIAYFSKLKISIKKINNTHVLCPFYWRHLDIFTFYSFMKQNIYTKNEMSFSWQEFMGYLIESYHRGLTVLSQWILVLNFPSVFFLCFFFLCQRISLFDILSRDRVKN